MKLIQNLINRMFTHWVSTLFGLGYLVLLYLLAKKEITVMEFCMILPAILGIKGVFFNKDADKVVTKPEIKDKESNP